MAESSYRCVECPNRVKSGKYCSSCTTRLWRIKHKQKFKESERRRLEKKRIENICRMCSRNAATMTVYIDGDLESEKVMAHCHVHRQTNRRAAESRRKLAYLKRRPE